MLYILTEEDADDGMWFDEPRGYNSLSEARVAAAAMAAPQPGYCRVIYRCDQPMVVAATQKLGAAGQSEDKDHK